MNLIAAVSKNWGIGKENDLLFHIPADMKLFRQHTEGHVIVIGRKTLESFPGKKPLKNRINIVLTRDLDYECEGAILCYSKEEVLDEIARFPTEEVYICGGEQIYRMFLDDCDTAYITKVEQEREADRFLENLDQSDHWKLSECSRMQEHEGVAFQFCTYQKISCNGACHACSGGCDMTAERK